MSAPPTRLFMADALKAARDTHCLELGGASSPGAPACFDRSSAISPPCSLPTATPSLRRERPCWRASARRGFPVASPSSSPTQAFTASTSLSLSLEEVLKGHAAIPVAVGSGTINDLTKLAPIARAALTCGGHGGLDGRLHRFRRFHHLPGHQSRHSPCPRPGAVVADLDVICAAPGRDERVGLCGSPGQGPRRGGLDRGRCVGRGADSTGQAWAIVPGRLRQEWPIRRASGVETRRPSGS